MEVHIWYRFKVRKGTHAHLVRVECSWCYAWCSISMYGSPKMLLVASVCFFLFQLNAREDKFDRLAGALVEKVRRHVLLFYPAAAVRTLRLLRFLASASWTICHLNYVKLTNHLPFSMKRWSVCCLLRCAMSPGWWRLLPSPQCLHCRLLACKPCCGPLKA